MMNPQANKLAIRVAAEGGRAFLVGGCVRDEFLGRESKDVDIVVTGLTVEAFKRAVHPHSFVGKSFPVVKMGDLDVAMARTERKVGDGHDDFECFTDGVTIEQDLARRDLTINAIAKDIRHGMFVDPFHGITDIRNGVLRHITADAFAEDPLRVFRVARFAAQLGFDADQSLVNLMREMRDEVRYLSAERVFEEMTKALRSDNPRRFFDVLSDTWNLAHWFPELFELTDRPAGSIEHHPEGTCFEHTMQVITRCKELGGDEVAMFAALVHDLGKGVTPEDNLPHHYNHEQLGVPLVRALGARLRAPTNMIECGVAAARDHLNVHRLDSLRAVKRVDLMQRLGRWAETVALVSQADAQGRGPTFWDQPYPSRDLVTATLNELRAVRGEDVLSKAELEGRGDGDRIACKMRMARAKRLKHAFGLKK